MPEQITWEQLCEHVTQVLQAENTKSERWDHMIQILGAPDEMQLDMLNCLIAGGF